MNDRHFDSVQDMMAVQPSAENITAHVDKAIDMPENLGDWYGIDTLSALRGAVERSWADGLQKMNKHMREVHMSAVGSVKRRRVRQDFGDHLDIHRVYAGDLSRAWLATERKISHGLGRDHVTILASIGGDSNRSADAMFWKGATVCVLAQGMEASGRRVQIVGFYHGGGAYRGRKGTTTVSFTLKDYDTPLDVNRVAATTALAGFFRIWCFRALLSAKDVCGMGFGHHESVPSGYVKDAKKLPEKLRRFCGSEGTIVIDGVWSKSDAQDLLDKTAAEIAGKGVTA